MKLKTILAVSSMLITQISHAEKPWRFILLADWHSAEKYTQSQNDPDWLQAAVDEDVANVKMLKENYGGELILMPGDSNGGHWDTSKFIKKFKQGLKPEESILQAGKLCYDGMISSFKKGGYSKLIMAVGDHEVGDNPWPAGSDVSRCQPQFREAFAKSFNTNPDGGTFLYTKPIGNTPSQPLGTPFEETAYAYQHKNALFVTLDAFYQEDPNKSISHEGSVTGAVTTEQLLWFENVLSEARKDSSIKHIIVQSHLPVIYPVRKVNSSGMFMDDGMNSPFWKVMQKYNVDIYFAGEVHANTVTKDPNSDIVQVVSRGNFFNNFQTVDISDDSIKITCYNQNGPDRIDNNYEESGLLIIDKSSSETSFTGEGHLSFLDLNKPVFKFSFEEEFPYSDRPLIGIAYKKDEIKVKKIRGVYCDNILPNSGSFSDTYDALHNGVKLVDGKHGKAGRFTEKSVMSSFAMGPLDKGKPVSIAAWVKTTSSANQVIVNTGSIWSREVKKFINLHLNNGVPEVVVSENHCLTADTGAINDGDWHHVAISTLEENSSLSKISIYVDGKKVPTRLKNNKDQKLFFTQSMRLSVGGLGYSTQAFAKLKTKPFVGELDEVTFWTRPISTEEVILLAK